MFDRLVDSLVFNTNLSSISAISWRYIYRCLGRRHMGVEIEHNFSSIRYNPLERDMLLYTSLETRHKCIWRNKT